MARSNAFTSAAMFTSTAAALANMQSIIHLPFHLTPCQCTASSHWVLNHVQ